MRLPRVRLTVRQMMAAVAVVAILTVVLLEFQDGLPPRFVVHGIPKRIDRLRPGMTWEQTREVLGLDKLWLLGGTGARYEGGDGNGRYMHEVYTVRPNRLVVRMARVGGGNPAPVKFWQSTALIQVWFSTDYHAGVGNWRRDKSTRLVRATFSSDSTKVADMPRSR